MLETETSRRDFVKQAALAGFALAVQPVMAETAILTDSGDLETDWVTIPVSDGTIAAYRARPKGPGKFPMVLVIQEIFGLHTYIQDVCRRLAKAGYQALAVNLYQRQGDATRIADIQALIKTIVSKVPDAQVMSDLDAAVAWAERDGHADMARVAVTGFCWGGRITWLYAAHNPALKAGVAWYGRLVGAKGAEPDPLHPKNPIDLVTELQVPVLGLYGGQDQGIAADTIEAMRNALKNAGKTAEIHVYPDAGHGFHADYRPSYNPADATDGWRRMLAWFKMNGM